MIISSPNNKVYHGKDRITKIYHNNTVVYDNPILQLTKVGNVVSTNNVLSNTVVGSYCKIPIASIPCTVDDYIEIGMRTHFPSEPSDTKTYTAFVWENLVAFEFDKTNGIGWWNFQTKTTDFKVPCQYDHDVWFKFTKQGATKTGYVSFDGVNWESKSYSDNVGTYIVGGDPDDTDIFFGNHTTTQSTKRCFDTDGKARIYLEETYIQVNNKRYGFTT